MYMEWQSKGPELGGCKCQEIGAKIGRVTTILMAKASHLRSPQGMAVQWCPTMLPHLIGPLARPILVLNSARHMVLHYYLLRKPIF